MSGSGDTVRKESSLGQKFVISKTTVYTKNGPVKGIVKNSRDPSKQYVAFMGLRYAEKPERFQLSHCLQETWTEPKIADKRGNICAQIGLDMSTVGSEDCLFLNVYVPQSHLENEGKMGLPVMAFIHGGGFVMGEGHTYRPQYFMENEDVILITLNYRLGVFGFLSFGDETIPGNIGLRDVLTALTWIQDNIAAFKGDPENVTIFGESAGSVAIDYLLMTPLSKGLFHKAIMQSGSFSLWGYDPSPKETAMKLAKHLKCKITGESEKKSRAIRDYLLKIPTEEIGWAHAQFDLRWPTMNIISRCLPTAVEPRANAFFHKLPHSFFTSRNNTEGTKYANNHVKVTAGFNRDEGSTLFTGGVMAENKLEELDKKWDDIAPTAFCYESFFPQMNLQSVSRDIRKFYFGNASLLDENQLKNLEDLYSDIYFVLPMLYSEMEMVQQGMTVYPYVFNYDGGWGLREAFQLPKTVGNVGHADELQYLFYHPVFSRPFQPGSEQELFSKRLVKLWTSFARNGCPELESTWEIQDEVTWNPLKFTSSGLSQALTLGETVSIELMEINKELKSIKVGITDKLGFWKEIVKKYGFMPYKEVKGKL